MEAWLLSMCCQALTYDLDLLQTFIEADLAGDGRISPEEWFALVDSNPEVISYMTVGVLRELTVKCVS